LTPTPPPTTPFPYTTLFRSPNGYLHAGAVVTFADTLAGYGCIAHLPGNAQNFTTVELKANFLNTAAEGVLYGEARAVHLGRTTRSEEHTSELQSRFDLVCRL